MSSVLHVFCDELRAVHSKDDNYNDDNIYNIYHKYSNIYNIYHSSTISVQLCKTYYCFLIIFLCTKMPATKILNFHLKVLAH